MAAKASSKPVEAEPAGPVYDLRPSAATFPIVGIGASAGGLEALEEFLKHVPPSSGMAFVVVQHLDPTHKGMLVELLQRATPMPVDQARDGVQVEPDHVYVIPPNQDLSLLHGSLHLLPQAFPRGLNLPIDFFFRSLAEDQHERSIGVILSGMGSDGTLGLRAIKEKAGAAFVQALTSAKFDGMPRSAIDAGVADVVAPVAELPEKIIGYREHAPYIARPEVVIEDKASGALERVFVLLRSQTGNDFSLYKRSTVFRRIERRLGLHQIGDIAHYVRYLRENPREIELLFDELLIGVTSFFREPTAWEHLKTAVLPGLIAERAPGRVLRAWVPGCSTGEEAYSLAMVFLEAVESFKDVRNLTLQIFATDLDRHAIDRARVGHYPDSIAADVSPERLRRFFVRDDHGYRVGKEIREMVMFAPQNIIMDPPFTRLDLLLCRNLLIYLSGELQKKLIPLFHYSLNPGGVLFLGSAETIGSHTGLFGQLDRNARLYRRLEEPVMPRVPVAFPATFPTLRRAEEAQPKEDRPVKPSPPNLQALADRLLVQRYAPVGILCDDKGDVLYISGRAGGFLEPPVGKANLSVFAMAREGLRYKLKRAFLAVLREERPVTVHGLNVDGNGGTRHVDLTVEKITEPKELRGTVMVVFTDRPEPPPKPAKASRAAAEPARVAALQAELQRASEEVTTTREEMQTSQEELKSTNEELQSTNEELTTSKEEMQSLNEELQTVNQELQGKVDELSRSNNDMKNLLNSTEIATLFLDGDLHVRRFTTPAAKIIKLIPADAGRPISDIASDLDYPDLVEDAREVLQTLIFRERKVATRDGRAFLVRIMPYRTLDNVIDGVVITFTDARAERRLEGALADRASELQQMLESVPALVWEGGPDGAWDKLGRQWVKYTGLPESEQVGDGWLEQVHPEDRQRVRREWQGAVGDGATFNSELRLRGAGGAYRWFKARAVAIRGPRGAVVKWFGTCLDVDEIKRDGAPPTSEPAEPVLDGAGEGYLSLDEGLRVTYVNRAAARFLRRDREDLVGASIADALPADAGELGSRLVDALRRKAPISFDARLDGAPDRYRIRVYPQPERGGLLVLFERVGGGHEDREDAHE